MRRWDRPRLIGWSAAIVFCIVVWVVIVAIARADSPGPAPAPAPATPELVPAAKLRKAVDARDRARAEVRALRATLRQGPDFDVSLQLAGIVFGQDWHHLRSCALSEGARVAERHQRFNRRDNAGGSGAHSSFQFMRTTFLSTPFAGLDWSRQDVQAFAASWMWAQGRRGEWAGSGC